MNKKEKKYIMSYKMDKDSAYEKWAEKILAGESIPFEELEKLAETKSKKETNTKRKDR